MKTAIDTTSLLDLIGGKVELKSLDKFNNFLQNLDSQLIIPTPVLAEVMVKETEHRLRLVKDLQSSGRIEIASFDEIAAIEFGFVYPLIVKNNSNKDETKIKVKFDNQILTICKVHGVSNIITEDDSMTKKARLLKIEPISLRNIS